MKKRNAFTMIELIVVLVVLAIIASYSIPRVKRDTRLEAMTQMLHMIRYTQNLALHDSKHRRYDSRWQRAYWKFQIYKCKNTNDTYFLIGTNNDLNYNSDPNNISIEEAAIDPSNGKPLFWKGGIVYGWKCPNNTLDIETKGVSPNIFITKKYGINNVVFNDCKVYKNSETKSSVKHIGFDGFGRPYKSFTNTTKPDHWGYAVEVCSITFSFTDTSINPFTIDIDNETGYATVRENPNL